MKSLLGYGLVYLFIFANLIVAKELLTNETIDDESNHLHGSTSPMILPLKSEFNTLDYKDEYQQRKCVKKKSTAFYRCAMDNLLTHDQNSSEPTVICKHLLKIAECVFDVTLKQCSKKVARKVLAEAVPCKMMPPDWPKKYAECKDFLDYVKRSGSSMMSISSILVIIEIVIVSSNVIFGMKFADYVNIHLIIPIYLIIVWSRNAFLQFGGIGMQCPPGMEQDGSCQFFSFCVDPKEHCYNGACCQPSKLGSIVPGPGGFPVVGSPFCPPGMYVDGGCSVLKFCFDPKEQCIGNYCCQQEQGINGMVGISGYGLPGTFGGFAGGLSPYGISGGIGIGGCIDTQAGCAIFVTYCGLDTIREACLLTCGICHGGVYG